MYIGDYLGRRTIYSPDALAVVEICNQMKIREELSVATIQLGNEEYLDLGLATGERAGLFVLDSDKPDGEKTVEDLSVIYGPLPPTLTVRSGKGGTHRYFRWPTDGRIVRSRVYSLARTQPLETL